MKTLYLDVTNTCMCPSRETGEESVAEFELSSKSYPTLHFSCVRSYLAVSDSPLE